MKQLLALIKQGSYRSIPFVLRCIRHVEHQVANKQKYEHLNQSFTEVHKVETYIKLQSFLLKILIVNHARRYLVQEQAHYQYKMKAYLLLIDF